MRKDQFKNVCWKLLIQRISFRVLYWVKYSLKWSLYTCFFLRSVRWFGDSDKCCYKCSATTYPSHTPYSHDESLSRYPKSSCATWWGTDYHCHITCHTPCNSWWNCRPKTTLVAYWRGKFCLINNYFPWMCVGYEMVDSQQGA